MGLDTATLKLLEMSSLLRLCWNKLIRTYPDKALNPSAFNLDFQNPKRKKVGLSFIWLKMCLVTVMLNYKKLNANTVYLPISDN